MTGLFWNFKNLFTYPIHKISTISDCDCRDASNDLRVQSLIQRSARFTGYETSYSIDPKKSSFNGS